MLGQTSTTIAQQAIDLIGDNQPALTGVAPTFDTSAAGIVLSQIYVPTVQEVQKRFAWDSSRRQIALSLSGNAGPYLNGQFPYEYLYPSNGIEVWEVQPATLVDPNDPLPQDKVIGNTLVGGVQTKVIWSGVQGAVATYNNNPTESTWDAVFTEAVVRALGEKLARAIAGKPETAISLLQTGEAAVEIAAGRPG